MLTELTSNLEKLLNDIDTNVLPDSILDGKTILGVNGTAIQLKGTHIEIIPSKYVQTNIPTGSFNGYTFVKIQPVKSDIDGNIIPSNIKSGKSILGIHGTLSDLTETEYEECLGDTIDILGSLLYVTKGTLVIKSNIASIEEDTMTITGTIQDNTLVL